MKTLALFADKKRSIPAGTAWYLDSLGEFRCGTQELYTRQSPQKLRILRKHAIIQSAVSSIASKALRWTPPASKGM